MIERSPERDTALRAMLPHVPDHGWTEAALRHGLASPEAALAGLSVADAPFLFPTGPVGMVEAWCDLADRDMAGAAEAEQLTTRRIPARIRRVIELRLRAAQADKAAVRRGLALLALPWNARAAIRCTARTVDAMWYAAGDTSADISWYTRRASLAAVYGTTLAFWLTDESDDLAPTMAFLDRRLRDLARLSGRRKPKAA